MITEEYVTADSCHQCVVPENIQFSTPWIDVGNSKGEEGVSKPYIFKGKCAPKQEFPEGWQGGGGAEGWQGGVNQRKTSMGDMDIFKHNTV